MRSSSPYEFTTDATSSHYHYYSSLHMHSASSSYPASSSSSFTPSPSKSKSKSKTQPTHQHRPASIHSNPRPKSVDMSRLLDPAYLPSSSRAHPSHPSHRHSSPSHVSVFIDTNGEAHDPDYRHFPITPTRRRGARSNRNSSGGMYGNDRRPAWWSEDDEAILGEDDEEAVGDEDEEDDSEPFFLNNGAHPQNGARYKAGGAAAHRRRRRSSPGPYVSSTGYSSAAYERGQSTTMSMRNSPTLGCGRKRDGSFSTTTTSSGSAGNAYYSSFAGHSPATTTSTLPTSWESDKGVLGRLWRGSKVQKEEESDGEVEEKERGCVMKKIRRLSRGDKEKEKEKEKEEEYHQHVPMVYRASVDLTYSSPRTPSRPLPIAEEKTSVNHEEEDEEEEERRQRKEREEYVPTCGQSLRRQWAAFSLSLRFSLFRAQRRISRRVNSLR